MHKLLLTITISIGLIACGSSDNSNDNSDVQPPTTPPSSSMFSALRTTMQQELQVNTYSPAVSVAIYHKGEVVFAEAFGHTQLGGDQNVSKDTLFQLGSVTKMFTALATLQLVDRGMLHLDDKLVDVLPDIQYSDWQSQSWQAISIHDLLSHQSGLYDDYPQAAFVEPLLPAMTVSYPQNTILMNPPGYFYNYSNPNFSFLGAVVEQLTQTEYRQWMQEQVFEPLGMLNTTMLTDRVAEYGDYVLGVNIDSGEPVAMQTLQQVLNAASVTPSGAHTWSTATELVKIAGFLFEGNNDVLSDHLRESLTSKQISIDNESYYGYGIILEDGFELDNNWYNQMIWQHGGFVSEGNYQAQFVMLPEQEVAVAILSTGPESFDDTLYAAITSVVDLSNSEAIQPDTVDPVGIDNHVGTYIDYANGLTFEVAKVGEVLRLQVPELDAIGANYSRILQALDDGTFLATTEELELNFTFVPEVEGGESVYMASREAVGIKLGYAQWSRRP